MNVCLSQLRYLLTHMCYNSLTTANLSNFTNKFNFSLGKSYIRPIFNN